MREREIKDIIGASNNAIADLEDLLTKDIANNSIYKRAFIRRMADLGEALTFFREDNPLLKEIQDKRDTLIQGFTSARNKLLHDYILEHHDGNERVFNEKLDHLQTHLVDLKSTLHIISNKPEVINGEKCQKIINSPPDDSSKYTILDYAKFMNAEMLELSSVLTNQAIDIKNLPDDADKKYKQLAVENYIENICSYIKAYNGRFNTYGYDQVDTMNQVWENLSDEAGDFFLNANKFRRTAAHDLNRAFDANTIADVIESIQDIQENYITPVITYLHTAFYQEFYNQLQTKGFSNQLAILNNIDNLLTMPKAEFQEQLNAIKLGILNTYANIYHDPQYLSSLGHPFYEANDLNNPQMQQFFNSILPSDLNDAFNAVNVRKERIDAVKAQFEEVAASIEQMPQTNKENEIAYQQMGKIMHLMGSLDKITQKDYPNAGAADNSRYIALQQLLINDHYSTIDDFKQNFESQIGLDNINYNFNDQIYMPTPLHLAILSGNQEIVGYLLSKGANPYLPDSAGSTPLQWAYHYNQGEIVKLLCDHIKDRMTQFSKEEVTDINNDIKQLTLKLAQKTSHSENINEDASPDKKRKASEDLVSISKDNEKDEEDITNEASSVTEDNSKKRKM